MTRIRQDHGKEKVDRNSHKVHTSCPGALQYLEFSQKRNQKETVMERPVGHDTPPERGVGG